MIIASNEVVITVESIAERPEEIKWIKVFEKTYSEAYVYSGKAIQETCEFLIDPFKLFIDWKTWATNELYKDFEKKAEENKLKLMKLEIYVCDKELLWGLVKYPAIRVVAIYHSSPVHIYLVLAVVMIILALIAIILHEVKEIDWGAPLSVLGLLVVGGVLLYAITREKS
ncbi:MAG: hypothetical protein QXR05_10945 [Candidatus Methanomethylicia archaeon]